MKKIDEEWKKAQTAFFNALADGSLLKQIRPAYKAPPRKKTKLDYVHHYMNVAGLAKQLDDTELASEAKTKAIAALKEHMAEGPSDASFLGDL